MKVEPRAGVTLNGWSPLTWAPMKWGSEGNEAKGFVGLDVKPHQAS